MFHLSNADVFRHRLTAFLPLILAVAGGPVACSEAGPAPAGDFSARLALTGDGGTDADAGGTDGGAVAKTEQQLQSDYVDLRFGMMMHFGILTYTGSWAQANLDINQFNPVNLNCGQWADAAVAAHMTFGVLTTRHHDGFALWPSAASNFNVGHISWRIGQGDVVREYVDAFRSRGLLPGLYYSIWDNTEGIGNTNPPTAAQIAYVKTQLTELLTNYGPIPILMFDGWSWKIGHQAVAYQQIRELVKSLQPNCLMTDHTGLVDPWEVDVMNFEEPKGSWAPVGNTIAAEQDQKINGSGGNDWFWAPNIGSLMTVDAVVNQHLAVLEPRYTNFLLNCPPNRDGLMDSAIVSRLAEVGAAWSPNLGRAPLPAQGPVIQHPYTPVSATATSGTALNAIDGINDVTNHTLWKSSRGFPQSVTADLGQSYPDVGMVAVLPPYARTGPTTSGNVTGWAVLVSTDGAMFTQAASGTWPADAKLHTAIFSPVAARYVRFEVRAANGTTAQFTDMTIGANR
jgi:alpha-L-fucosidase